MKINFNDSGRAPAQFQTVTIITLRHKWPWEHWYYTLRSVWFSHHSYPEQHILLNPVSFRI